MASLIGTLVYRSSTSKVKKNKDLVYGCPLNGRCVRVQISPILRGIPDCLE